MKSSKIVNKEKIIELMITKKSQFRPWNGKKIRLTLPLGKSQRNEKINLVINRSLQVNPAIKKHQVFHPYPIIPLGLLQPSLFAR